MVGVEFSPPGGFAVTSSSAMDNDLLLEIRNFLDQAASLSASPRICTHCGKEMGYRDATFIVYGSASSWKIRLPVCDCEQVTNAAKSCAPEYRTAGA
jgi:hypothetical protein